MKECFLCLQRCIIPIQLKYFPCSESKQISCHTFQRICISCFLSNHLLKCSFCYKEKENDNFEIDFISIQKDEYSILTCPFCKDFQGNHINLWKHMNDSCISFCKCNKLYLIKKKKNHFEKECSIYKWCSICNNGVLSCPHLSCSICSNKNHSNEDCPERKLECSECSLSIPAKDYIEHHLEHIECIKSKIDFFSKSLKSEKTKYYKLMNQIPELYENVYHEKMLE